MRCRFLLVLAASCALLTFARSGYAEQQVVFQRQVARPGDSSRQSLDCDLDIEMSIQQGGNVVQSQQQMLRRQQLRTLTILEVKDEAPTRARVKYEKSAISLVNGDQTQDSDQPVTGKSYDISRQDGQLVVVYPDGTAPPEAEVALVNESMSSFGLPNPITTFFDGRTVQVGDILKLPPDLARDLLGFAEAKGNVSSFLMRLVDVRPGPAPIAIFSIELVAQDPNKTRVVMKLDGRMMMETQTCRAVLVEMGGPVSVSEMHGPPQGRFEVLSKGDISVAVSANYVRR